MSKIIIILAWLFILVNSEILIEKYQWTANLGQQYPGITPLFSRINHSIAIASLLQDNNRQFHIVVHQYSINGKLEAKCDSIVPIVSKRIWDLKMQEVNDSWLAISWLYSNGIELGVRVLQVNVASCNLRDTRVALYDHLDLVLYVPYYLLPRGGNDGLFLFVKSPQICQGICRLEIEVNGQFAKKVSEFLKENNRCFD